MKINKKLKEGNLPDLYDSSLYINREISWLEFNKRCLAEANESSNLLLERVKFLAIAYGNLDEFFMIRVPGLIKNTFIEKLGATGPDAYPDKIKLLSDINNIVVNLIEGYEKCWSELKIKLSDKGIRIKDIESLTDAQIKWAKEYYLERVHPLLTPLALDVSHPFPFISSNSLNIAVKMRNKEGENLYARVKIPSTILLRFVKMPSAGTDLEYMQLEDIIKMNVGLLFSGLEIIGAYLFRITRNADIKVTIDEACDLISAVETSLDSRDNGFPVRMLTEEKMPSEMVSLFGRNLKLANYQIHKTSPGGMLLTDLWQIANLNIPKLKEKSFVPYTPPEFGDEFCIFDTIKKKDWILFHPYESFDIIVKFINESADDPDVQSIKICLYRIGNDESIINALIRARENDKTVSVLMELRAKFDETNNIRMARELEKIGVHVVYGPVELKVHSKLLQIVRLEGDHLVRYTHLSSGNYNIGTSKQYCDISYLTTNNEIGEEVGELFNALTGFFIHKKYKHLLVAPLSLKSTLIEKIKREVDIQKSGGKGRIVMKANGLVDSDIISELYKASMANVKIDLNIRGLCCLRPGIKGISENISVTSIVDRFLEHSRIYYFENDGDSEMFMGSSDLMPRNLMARVEVLFPILDKDMLKLIKENIMNIHLRDNVKAKKLNSDGSYISVTKDSKDNDFRSQQWFIENRGIWHGKY